MTENDIGRIIDEKFTAFAKQIHETNAREKLLDRLEAHGVKSHLRPGYEDDLRLHFSKRAENGEDLQAKGVAEHIESYRVAKPNLFASPARTTPTVEGEQRKGTNGDATDHARSSKAEYTQFLAKFAPGIRG